jgi:hypothetical protein
MLSIQNAKIRLHQYQLRDVASKYLTKVIHYTVFTYTNLILYYS